MTLQHRADIANGCYQKRLQRRRRAVDQVSPAANQQAQAVLYCTVQNDPPGGP